MGVAMVTEAISEKLEPMGMGVIADETMHNTAQYCSLFTMGNSLTFKQWLQGYGRAEALGLQATELQEKPESSVLDD